MEETPPALSSQSPTEPPAPPMSVTSRLVNVFASPGEVFADIKNKPVQNANWAMPALILILVSWLASTLIFSQEPIRQQLKEISLKAVQKQAEKKNVPKEQMDKQMEMVEKFGTMGPMIAAFFAPIFIGFATPFFWGLILWLVGSKALGGVFPYMKGVEAAGLAGMIMVLDTIVRSLLVIVMGNVFVSPSLALLIKDWNPENKVHALLGYFNIMTFWLLAVRAIALSKLSNVSFGRAALWVFGVWIGYSALFFGFGVLMQQIFSKMGGG
jgi:hypothetical protein